MAITWREHIKNTMARMSKGTHLKEVLKAASKTWKSVKKDASVAAAAPAAPAKSRRARKGSRKGSRKSRRSTRRARRGGAAVMAADAGALKGNGGLSGSPFGGK